MASGIVSFLYFWNTFQTVLLTSLSASRNWTFAIIYLTHLNFRSPLIFAQICAKINGSENRTHISYLKINGSTQIRSRINVYDTGCAKINGAKIRVSENWWCAKFNVSKVYIYIYIYIYFGNFCRHKCHTNRLPLQQQARQQSFISP